MPICAQESSGRGLTAITLWLGASGGGAETRRFRISVLVNRPAFHAAGDRHDLARDVAGEDVGDEVHDRAHDRDDHDKRQDAERLGREPSNDLAPGHEPHGTR